MKHKSIHYNNNKVKNRNKTKIKHKPGLWYGEWPARAFVSMGYDNPTSALQEVMDNNNAYNDSHMGVGIEVQSLTGGVVYDSAKVAHSWIQIMQYGSFFRNTDKVYAYFRAT